MPRKTVQMLIYAMQIGEEIDFSIDGRSYFIEPDYAQKKLHPNENEPPYPIIVLFDCEDSEKCEEIFRGSAEELVEYVFPGNCTLLHDFEKFNIDWLPVTIRE